MLNIVLCALWNNFRKLEVAEVESYVTHGVPVLDYAEFNSVVVCIHSTNVPYGTNSVVLLA
jgi:hypothetical protein